MSLRTESVDFHGTPCISLHAEDGARAVVALHGAHLLSWVPADGRERLFLSERARYEPGAAIRGGVPVIFPQFAARGPLPKHGFARTLPWRFEDAGTRATFALADGPATAIWPHAFIAHVHVAMDDSALAITLECQNRGTSDFTFTAALHTYLAVDDLGTASLHGLEGCAYEDSANGGASRQHHGGELRFDGEIDRIYRTGAIPVALRDGPHRLAIAQQGFADTVVWNPGESLAATIGDLAPHDYRRFVCVEPGQVLQPVRLAPGERWSGTQHLR